MMNKILSCIVCQSKMETKHSLSKIPTPISGPNKPVPEEIPNVAEAVKKLESSQVDNEEPKKSDGNKPSMKTKEPTMKEILAMMNANIATLVNQINQVETKMDIKFEEVKSQMDPAKLASIETKVDEISTKTKEKSEKIEENSNTL